jgi:peptidoglycan-associated lipoprotein
MLKMKRYALCICAGIILSFGLKAQPLDEVPVEMTLEVADERLATGDYYNALALYEEAYSKIRDLDLAHQIAHLHLMLRDYKRAERWYGRVVEKDEMNKFPEAVFEYAKILKINGKYQEAIDGFNYLATVSENDSLLTLADNEVAGIQLAIKEEAPIELVVENIGRKINSSYSESSPQMTPEGDLYFSSIKTRELIVLNGKEGDYFSKIYQTQLDKKGKWETAKSLSSKINREGYHTSNPSFSDDGTRMFFTRALLELNEIIESKIYYSEQSGKGWGPANEVTNLNGSYLNKHPAPGQLYGRDVLFFTSDMEGGFGGYDLYYATSEGGNAYSLPVNLGPKINTSGDELTPFFQNNRLYFSTDSRPSLGGYDIYFSDWDGEQFSESQNMGAGYNSSYDDLSFSINSAGTRGFIVSNRPAEGTRSVKSKTCCDEVFEFELRDIVIDLIAQVIEGQTPLKGAKVTLFEIENNQPGKSTDKQSDETSIFQFLLDSDKAYKAIAELEGYYPGEISFNTTGIYDEYTVKKLIRLEKIPETSKDVEIVMINEPIRLNQIYYDFDDDKILSDAEKDLSYLLELMNQYPDMVIELSSHTDAQGNDEYNDRLSLRRAQSAKNWLLSRGVSSKRIEAVGYGEQQIINHCINGMDCTDDEHRVNRRTEFKIIAGPTSIEIKKELQGNDESGSSGKKK